MLTRDLILAANDRPTEEVDVPEWGGTVKVRALSCDQKDTLDASLSKIGPDGKSTTDMTHWRASMLVLGIVDEDGKSMFSLADVTVMGTKSPAAADRVIEVLLRLSYPRGVTLGELEKN